MRVAIRNLFDIPAQFMEKGHESRRSSHFVGEEPMLGPARRIEVANVLCLSSSPAIQNSPDMGKQPSHCLSERSQFSEVFA